MATQPTALSLSSRWRSYFGDAPDFHSRLFITSAAAGCVMSLCGVLANVLNSGGATQIFLCLLLAAVSLTMIWFARFTGRYEVARVTTVVIVFLGIFPVMFFTGGGYDSGMPALLVFAVGFTGLAVMGPGMWVLVGSELVVYTGCCLLAYAYPGLVTPVVSQTALVTDVVICVAIAACHGSRRIHLLRGSLVMRASRGGRSATAGPAALRSGTPRRQAAGTSSPIRVSTRRRISSRIGRTASMPWPAGSSSTQSR